MKKKSNGGFSIVVLTTTLVFVIQKLTGTIDWSWFKVFLPMIIWAGVFMFLMIIIGIAEFLRQKIEEKEGN